MWLMQNGSVERSNTMFKKSTLWLAFAVFASLIVVVLGAAAQTSTDKSAAAQTSSSKSDAGPLPSTSQSDSTTDIKTKLHASDEEWKVISPMLRRVMTASAAAETRIDGSNSNGLGSFGGGMRGGPGFGNDSFTGPGDSSSFGRGGPGFGGRGDMGDMMGGPGFGGPGMGGGRGGGGRGGMGDMMGGGPGFGGRGGMGDMGGGPGFGGPGMGGPPGMGGGSVSNAITQKLGELKTMLADPKATPEQLKEKIADVRSERKKATAELEAARKDLRQLLTQNQEAVLISLGYLD
jgi:hypothetical protein